MSKKQTLDKFLNSKLPYSPVVIVDGNYLFSGVIPKVDDEHGVLVSTKIRNQIQEVLEKIKTLLADCGLSVNDIYGVTIMLAGSMKHFKLVNEMYIEFLSGVEVKPRRKAFAVAALPFDALIEIEFEATNQKKD
jgi:enamine deaminase RidA (YjgF/YER057c/UK114 family)